MKRETLRRERGIRSDWGRYPTPKEFSPKEWELLHSIPWKFLSKPCRKLILYWEGEYEMRADRRNQRKTFYRLFGKKIFRRNNKLSFLNQFSND